MKRKIRVMLVEDNPEYREVIKLALEDENDIELINQFGTAEIALRSLQDQKCEFDQHSFLQQLKR